MRKLLLALFVLCSFFASAQKIQKVNTYGYEYNRFITDTLFALPGDTFAVPAAYQAYPFLARKATTLFVWNTGTFIWEALAGGTGTVDSLIYSTRAWRQKGDDSLGAVIAGRTWQQSLTAGSTLTTDNKVTLNNTVFSIVKSGTDTMFLIDPVNLTYTFGDGSGAGNATSLKIDDNTTVISLDGKLRVQGSTPYDFSNINWPIYWDEGSLEYTAGWSLDSMWRDSDSIKYRILGPPTTTPSKTGTFGIYAPIGGGSYTFSNGLTEAAGAVKLGGTLTDATTTISGGDNNIEFDNFGEIIISGNSAAGKGYVGILGRDSLRLLADDGIKNSFIHILKNKIIAKAYLGEYYIDTINHTISTTGKKILLRDTATGLVQNIDPALLGFGATNTLATFGAGAGLSTDTAAFQTTSIYGSFYNDGNDTLIITKAIGVLQGSSPSITPTIYFNDSLNVTAGATKLVNSPSALTNTTTGTAVTSFDNYKIPPGVWVWVSTGTVGTKPTYFSLSLIGYKKPVI